MFCSLFVAIIASAVIYLLLLLWTIAIVVIGRNDATATAGAKFTGVAMAEIGALAALIAIVALVAFVSMVAGGGRVCCYMCFWQDRCFC